MNSANDALQLPKCKKYFWCDSKVVLQWITNQDLRLPKFVARCIDIILCMSHAEDWHYCATDANPADVATRPLLAKSCHDCMTLWLDGPNITALLATQRHTEPHTHTSVNEVKVQSHDLQVQTQTTNMIMHLVERSPDICTLKKRVAYLMAYTVYFTRISHRQTITQPHINSAYLDKAMYKIVLYV